MAIASERQPTIIIPTLAPSLCHRKQASPRANSESEFVIAPDAVKASLIAPYETTSVLGQKPKLLPVCSTSVLPPRRDAFLHARQVR
jgi:hypothetical protein